MANLTADDMNAQIVRKIWWVSVFIGLEIVAGLIGNAIVLYVFLRHYHHCNFRYFVLCIAFNDILSVFTIMPAEIATQLYWYIYPLHESFCKIKAFLNAFTISVEAFCLCAVALDRYRKLCAPHSWQIRPVHAFRICIIILMFSVGLSSPGAVLWGIYTFNITNVSVTVCDKDERFVKTGIHQNVIIATGAIVILVAIVTILFYVVLYFNFHRSFFKRKRKFELCKTCVRDVPNARMEANDNFVPDAKSQTTERNSIKHKQSDETSDDYSSKGSIESVLNLDNSNKQTTIQESIQLQTISCMSTRHQTKVQTNAKEENIHDIMKSISLEVKSKRKFSKQWRIRRSSKVTLTVSIIFSLTLFLFAGLQIFLEKDEQKLHKMSDSNKGLYFFGLRFVFINHVINPFVYWSMDREFRTIFKNMIYYFRRKL
ncbi:hypothetical protein DPMN_166639 [Dreissena polymorpha]|uniref:G-protein coupled receptors family 1 profile domain-containing protein n=1 Tax=Dreissena polymorpha TaxID=45954 RepID=A0A9D4IVM8_DREPO|nr:hypothetical protein DPMN_166639 [Dreissena polymorpha]